jgi:hypothetical protein
MSMYNVDQKSKSRLEEVQEEHERYLYRDG